MNGLGGKNGGGPGGIFVLDPETFDLKGRWEKDRGPQFLAYDFWWHLGHDTVITSEWATPELFENGLVPDALLNCKYGHAIHVWDLRTRTHRQMLDLGSENQMVLELRPAHDPRETYGFAGVAISVKDLSASIWMWHRESSNGSSAWKVRKIIEIPAEAAPADSLPELLKNFGAVPPLVSDIILSLDDRYLYVSCWGTGELRRYDVSDPFNPVLRSTLKIGGIANRTPHPKHPKRPLNGGSQMVELSRDGGRLYVTNSLYGSVDDQFYPDGIRGWMAKADIDPNGGMAFDQRFLVEFEGLRSHQVRLERGDASSDSYCYA
jgi:selenium-binding protein 1